MMLYSCSVCGFKGLELIPIDENNKGSKEICSCCGYQFNTPENKRNDYQSWRNNWLEGGGEFWYLPKKPVQWNLVVQLESIGYFENILIKKQNSCPVCGYDDLAVPAYTDLGSPSDEICICCGYQFGLDDFPDPEKGKKKWRENWIENGCLFWSKNKKPDKWSPSKQLMTLVNQKYRENND